MPSPYVVNIIDGEGSSRILNGSYAVTADVGGYDNASINPDSQVIAAGTDTYDFLVAATGTLTLHVTEEGTAGGTAVVGATFVRCDSGGTAYGDPVVSVAGGNAEFPFVPFAASGAPTIYYRQTLSADDHEFDTTLKSLTMTTSTETVEVANPLAALRTINLTDANYAGLPIETGDLTFTAN
ncbi:hypothetical protein [Oscillibacter sp.]|uniref:hypothetical protein n=1 Tax=Oscillibacter sp. TaxID=1945593 RepID=UPI00289ACEAF|nr:hypothetical protein [Oscillibacter sp.]